MTTAEWLGARDPRPPEQLVVRLAPTVADPGLEHLALQRLEKLIGAGDHTRAVAAELLAIDALVTYACEAAVERWQRGELGEDELTQWCEQFARRIAGVAGARS